MRVVYLLKHEYALGILEDLGFEGNRIAENGKVLCTADATVLFSS